jgi:putative endonuclease
MNYYVYILTNRWHTVLYIGMTRDIEGRVFDHKTKSNKGFSNKYNCDVLVHLESFNSAREAIDREKQLKKYRRAWKNDLINSENPKWEDLSEGWYDPRDIADALLKDGEAFH